MEKHVVMCFKDKYIIWKGAFLIIMEIEDDIPQLMPQCEMFKRY